MAAATKRKERPGEARLSREEGGKGALRTVLQALHSCALQLHQPEDVVHFNINWEKLQHLPEEDPALLCSVLQQHISSLQPILAQLQASLTEKGKHTVRLKKAEEECPTIDVEETMTTDSANVAVTHVPDKAVLNTSCVTDPTVVQIQAQKSEINRRIWAFIERKQAEINENNIREFCNVIDSNQEDSCARTDAVFTPFPGFKSHVKVSRVVNAYGPQTRSSGSSSATKAHSLQQDCGHQVVEERLQNIECHVQLLSGEPVPKDIYHRIKKLEDKILELESISPEYFQSLDISNKRKKAQPSHKYSLAELDQKMDALRQSLLQKSEKGIS